MFIDGHSKDLSHVADRRLLAPWARDRGIQLVDSWEDSAELVFVNPKSPVNGYLKRNFRTPMVYVLRDAYFLSEGILIDRLRSLSKCLIYRDSFSFAPYPEVLRKQLLRCEAVICACPEQEDQLQRYGISSSPILDVHNEYGEVSDPVWNTRDSISVLWEGGPSSIKSLKELTEPLNNLKNTLGAQVILNVITSERSPFILDSGPKYSTEFRVMGLRRESGVEIRLIPWTLENVREVASFSHFAVVPVDTGNQMNRLKAENRVLIAWRLGLPVLASPVDAHVRVAKSSGADIVCSNSQQWRTKMLELVTSRSAWERNVRLGQSYVRSFAHSAIVYRQLDSVVEKALGAR